MTPREHESLSASTRRPRFILLGIALAVVSAELIRTAWVSDDAAITLRTVLNLLHGFGATFNIDERVQAYTHPLWFLLLAATSLITRNVFVAAFALSIATSLAVAWLLITRVASGVWAGTLAIAILLGSKAYVDFSTSGLENPLTHLLLLVAVITAARATESGQPRAATAFFLTCSALFLSRPDVVVLILPLAVVVLWSQRYTPATGLRAVVIGAIPAVAWTLFSLFYYGFPVANTAYAKLAAGIPLGERIPQGVLYLQESFGRDPLTLVAIGIAALLGLMASRIDIALMAGALAYLGYVISIGGDFMSGRFLSAPLVLAAAVIARGHLKRWQLATLTAGVVVLAGIGAPATILSGARYAGMMIPESGIVDERGYYFQRYGMVPAPAHTFDQPRWELRERTVSVLCGNLGMTGIEQGPGAHLIDTCALSDPLLARLPAERTRRWRIGHFLRQLPTDYEESVARGGNMLADPGTREFYRSIRVITRDPLTSGRRLREIVRMNLGLVPPPDWDTYHHTKVPPSSKETGDRR